MELRDMIERHNVLPRAIWRERRISMLAEAIAEYAVRASVAQSPLYQTVQGWCAELSELLERDDV